MLLMGEGTVTFNLGDDRGVLGNLYYWNCSLSSNWINIDVTETTLTVGESVDFYFAYIPEDGWLAENLELTTYIAATGDTTIASTYIMLVD